MQSSKISKFKAKFLSRLLLIFALPGIMSCSAIFDVKEGYNSDIGGTLLSSSKIDLEIASDNKEGSLKMVFHKSKTSGNYYAQVYWHHFRSSRPFIQNNKSLEFKINDLTYNFNAVKPAKLVSVTPEPFSYTETCYYRIPANLPEKIEKARNTAVTVKGKNQQITGYIRYIAHSTAIGYFREKADKIRN